LALDFIKEKDSVETLEEIKGGFGDLKK